jgi:hypothetical protein
MPERLWRLPEQTHFAQFVGMAAAAFVAITQICTKDSLDIWLTISVIIFAFTIPMLVSMWFGPPSIPRDVNEFLSDWKHSISLVRLLILQLTTVVGFVSFFFHFGWIPGVLFLSAIPFACLRIFAFSSHSFPSHLLWRFVRAVPSLLIGRVPPGELRRRANPQETNDGI